MSKPKPEIITFKADASLLEAMQGIPNRSEFIRVAVLNALQNVCPLCRGTGTLTPDQAQHWRKFSEDHRLAECDDCHETFLVCTHAGGARSGHIKAKA